MKIHNPVMKPSHQKSRAWVDETVDGVETHWISGNENVPCSAVTKEGDAVV